MSEEEYDELLKAYTKEALANMIKADIRQRFTEPYASMYCQQFDNFKNVADFFEFAAKLMRRKQYIIASLCFSQTYVNKH